jgi:hypothetical protein
MLEFLRDVAEGIAAVFAALLPARVWPDLPSLPIRRMAPLSSILTVIASAVVGLGGFLAYSERVGRETAALLMKVGEAQLQGRLPADASVNAAPLGIAALTPLAFAFTPVGMLATYMALSGLVRATTCIVDDPIGDPVLSIVDGAVQRLSGKARRSRQRRARERAEGAEVPDRLYPADWARLTDADFVVVASRRKPDWDKGTFVITSDKWYVVGEPFDLQLADGLRTIYPLKEHTTRDVMRRGVQYELPPLRTRAPKR